MAKVSEKSTPKKSRATATPVSKVIVPSPSIIEKASSTALKKLQDLGLDTQLQADLEWCLGSYKFDKNPVGLYEMTQRAVAVFKEEQQKKTKGVTAKLITDLEKALVKTN